MLTPKPPMTVARVLQILYHFSMSFICYPQLLLLKCCLFFAQVSFLKKDIKINKETGKISSYLH